MRFLTIIILLISFLGISQEFHNTQKTLSVLIDTDGDGIDDSIDLDDDNDGIPDAIECSEVYCGENVVNGSFEQPTVNNGTWLLFHENNVPGWNTTATDGQIELWRSGFNGVPADDGNQFAELNANQVAALYQELCISGGSRVQWSVSHRGRNGVDEAVVKIGADLASATIVETMIDGNSWKTYTGTYNVPLGQDTTFFIFEAVNTSDGNNSTGNLIDNIVITILEEPICTTDFDGDGIPNSFDLDSDNDGIYDVVESGNAHLDNNNDGIIDNADINSGNNGLFNGIETITDNGVINFTVLDSDNDGNIDLLELDSDNDSCFDVTEAGYTDNNNDGILGNNPITTNANGIVISGIDGYTTPLDGDNNTIFDFQESANALAIITQPTPQIICENQATFFNIETNFPNVTSYLWQVNTGSGWTNLTDNTIYSGTNTNQLNLSNPLFTLNGNQYRVLINNLASVCANQLTSNEILLTVNELPTNSLTINETPICIGETTGITIQNSQIGISYQLRLDSTNANISTPINGTGGDISFNVSPTSTTLYNILATNNTSNCSIVLVEKSNIVVNAYPENNLPFQDQTLCFGNSLNLVLNNTQIDIDYQLRLDSDNSLVGLPISGNDSDIQFLVSPSATTTYNVLATNNTTSCSITNIETATVTVFPLPLVTPIVALTQCDDDNDGITQFNLTEANDLISADAANEIFTYYLTQADADGGLVADQIPNFTAYLNPIPLTGMVFARIETQDGCHRTAQIDLTVGATQIPANFNLNYNVCDNTDIDGNNTNGIVTFDFSDAEAQILAQFPPGNTVSFYTNLTDALAETNAIADVSNHRNEASPFVQNIYVRIDSDVVNACLGLGEHITLTVDPLPLNNPISDYVLCSDTDRADFDLTTKDIEVIGAQTQDILISYHTSLTHAQNNVMPVTTLTNALAQTIYVRAQFDDNSNGVGDLGECVSTDMSFELVVMPNPEITEPDPIEICNNQITTVYNLTVRAEQITNGDNSIALTYFESQTDLDNNIPIVNPTMFTNTLLNNAVLVLVTGTNTCTSVVEMQLQTIIYDNLNLTPTLLEECEIDNDGFDNFDLTRRENEILSELNPLDFTFTYYENEADAIEGNTNNISDSTTFTNTQAVTQTIYIRVQPLANACYQIAQLNILVNPVPEIQIEDEYVICLASNDTIIQPIEAVFLSTPPIDTQLNPAQYTFQWYEGENEDPANIILGETNPVFMPDLAGYYTVIATNIVSGCTIPATTLVVGSYPPLSILAEVTTNAFSNNDMISVSVTGNGTYEYSIDFGTWQQASTFNNVTGGEHQIRVRDIYNCNALEVQVTVMDYPKYFTPNDDGQNDRWQIHGISNQIDAKIYIYDRYGKLLKQLSPTSIGWDGTFNGRPLPTDDYWFTVQYNEPNNLGVKKQFGAHFSLKR